MLLSILRCAAILVVPRCLHEHILRHQYAHRLDGLAHRVRDGTADTFGHDVGDQIADHRVVLGGGDDAAIGIVGTVELVQHRVGCDQRQQGTEVSAQPHRDRGYPSGQLGGVRDHHAVLCGIGRQPPLEVDLMRVIVSSVSVTMRWCRGG